MFVYAKFRLFARKRIFKAPRARLNNKAGGSFLKLYGYLSAAEGILDHRRGRDAGKEAFNRDGRNFFNVEGHDVECVYT